MRVQREGRQSLFVTVVVSGMLALTAVVNAAEQTSHDHSAMDHSQMDHSKSAQAGQHVHHSHGKGSWMVEFEYMSMDMDGLLRGTDSVSTEEVSGVIMPFTNCMASKDPTKPYCMSPTKMTMDMGMLMGMYGFTDKWTGMLMLNYLDNSMDMVMNMSMMPGGPVVNSMTSSMETSGIGDTEVGVMYTINKDWTAALSLSIPTGSIDEKVTMMGNEVLAPYAMQLGTGTYDFIPAITYKGYIGSWSWGGQAEWRIHTGTNDNDYTWGDSFEIDAWGKYAINKIWGIGARLDYINANSISGQDPNIMPIMAPTSDPANYGGTRTDLSLGITAATGGNTFGLMYGVPIQQDVNGIQMEVQSIWSLTYQYMMM